MPRRIAIITGASTGIGRATAKRLAAEDYTVVVTARRALLLESLAEEIRSEGGEAIPFPGDIRDPLHCARLVETAAERGGIEVLVANAGMGYTGPFELMTDEEMKKLVEINILGVMRPVREAIPFLRASAGEGGGKIVIIGSVLSRAATPGTAVYCATKHAVVGFADALRHEVASDSIRVISVLPGYTSTDFFNAMIRRGDRAVDEIKKFWFFHSPEDVAEVIARRIRHPVREVVVGGLNTAVVLFATRLPGLFHRALDMADTIGKMIQERRLARQDADSDPLAAPSA